MNKFYLNKLETILTQKLEISPNKNILVAFSGGPDSVFLLYLLKKISKKLGLKVGAAHLNHCLRGEDSDADETFCTNFCNKFDIDIYIQKSDIRKISKKYQISIEEAGRSYRYSFFYKILKENNFDFIATAHHKDDDIEQVLMNFIRGCGIKGLCGIPKKRDKIIRPLLDFEKKEILSFLDENYLDYQIDKTNFESDFLRNKIRNTFIPMLEKDYNPLIKKGISNLSQIAALENTFIENFSKEKFLESCDLKNNVLKIDLNLFNSYDKAVKRRVLRQGIELLKGDLLKIELSHIDDIIKISSLDGSKEIHLPSNIIAQKSFSTLEIKVLNTNPRKVLKEVKSLLNFVINEPPQEKIEYQNEDYLITIETKKFNLEDEKNPEIISLNIEKIDFPITLRSVLPGDRFRPKNFNGRKKLKKILQEQKLSQPDKKRIVVLESNKKIYWISGVIKNHFNAFPMDNQKSIVIKRILR